MIWITWRQHRMQVLAGGLVLALLVPVLIGTGFEWASIYQSLVSCTSACGDILNQFKGSVQTSPVLIVLPVLPLLVGVFVGAPVARELEQKTYLLAWTQSITRYRWLAVKLSLFIGITLLAFILLVALMTWGSGPVDAALGPWMTFDIHGVVPIAYALFALVLGIAAGIVVRQTVAAMFSTFAVFVALRVAIAQLRPYFLPPLRDMRPATVLKCSDPTCSSFSSRFLPQPPYQTALVLQQDPVGHPSHANSVINFLVVYQPADRFWLFQGIETAIFLALAAALVTLTFWWVRKRIC